MQGGGANADTCCLSPDPLLTPKKHHGYQGAVGMDFFFHTIKIPNIITKSIICLGRKAAAVVDKSAFPSPAALKLIC